MVERDFLHTLLHFDVDTVSKRTLKQVRDHYLSQIFFQPYLVENVSRPCTAICSWIIAICKLCELH